MVISSGVDIRDIMSTREMSRKITWMEVETRHRIDQDRCLCGKIIVNYVKTPKQNPGISYKKTKKTKTENKKQQNKKQKTTKQKTTNQKTKTKKQKPTNQKNKNWYTSLWLRS
jgi:sRNA-binding protein